MSIAIKTVKQFRMEKSKFGEYREIGDDVFALTMASFIRHIRVAVQKIVHLRKTNAAKSLRPASAAFPIENSLGIVHESPHFPRGNAVHDIAKGHFAVLFAQID